MLPHYVFHSKTILLFSFVFGFCLCFSFIKVFVYFLAHLFFFPEYVIPHTNTRILSLLSVRLLTCSFYRFVLIFAYVSNILFIVLFFIHTLSKSPQSPFSFVEFRSNSIIFRFFLFTIVSNDAVILALSTFNHSLLKSLFLSKF